MFKFGDDITNKLESIREKLNIDPIEYEPPPSEIDDEVDGSLARLHDPNTGLLIRYGTPVFAYIRDHSHLRYTFNSNNFRRLHFSWCKTLQEKYNKGKLERYHITNRQDDKYRIEYSDRTEAEVPLQPCKHCLNKMKYNGFRFAHLWKYTQQEINDRVIKEFKAKECMRFLRNLYKSSNRNVYEKRTENLPKDFESSGYPDNWQEIFRSYQEQRRFICEAGTHHTLKLFANTSILPCFEQGADLSEPEYRYLLRVYQINGSKSDVRDKNLCCLCLECYAALHPNYSPQREDMELLQRLRRLQTAKS